MSHTYVCVACGDNKRRKSCLCEECLSIYGKVADKWPPWLREKVNSSNRWRYDEKIAFEHELPFGDDDLDEDKDPDFDEPLLTRDRTEMAFSSDRYGRTALPYAPYVDEEMNREYRKANGIPEILNIDDIDLDKLDAELLAMF